MSTDRRYPEGVANRRSPDVHAFPGAPAEHRYTTTVRVAGVATVCCSWCGQPRG